jgi:hypothetical protein
MPPPPVFISMMEDVSQDQNIMSKSLEAGQLLWSYQVTTTYCDLMKTAYFGTKVIVDDILLHDNRVQSLLLLWRCSLQLFLHQRASTKLKKCRSMPDTLAFVGIYLSREGNRPAQSNSPTCEALGRPATKSDILSIKGLFSWYYHFIDWFEVHTMAWQKIMSTLTDQKEMWTPKCEALLVCLKENILEGILLARAYSSEQFYLKTEWSKDGMGTVLLQAKYTPSSIVAARIEDDGDTKGGCRIWPIVLFSRWCQGSERD